MILALTFILLAPIAHAADPLPQPSEDGSALMDYEPVREAPKPAGIFKTELLYAQSKDVWSTVHEITAAQGNLDQISQVLQANYGTFEEAFADLTAKSTGINSGFDNPALRTIYFGVSADGLAYGMVQNPVVPELHADALITGTIQSGFEGSVDSLGIKTQVGGHFGMGMEKRIDAVSTDLIENLPIHSGRITLVGFDLGASRSTPLSPDYTLESRASIQDTFFSSTVAPSDLSTTTGGSSSYVRWKFKNDIDHPVDGILLDKDSIRLETIAGPQPLPVDILPVTWDYAHNLNSLPELGAMVGAGLAWDSLWGRDSELTARAGFYGGYPGGSVSLQSRAFVGSLQSWGIEGSSAYQTLGQRIWVASVGFRL